jgi:hypothetical protein
MEPAAFAPLARRLNLDPPPSRPAGARAGDARAGSDRLVVSLTDLRRFLEDPLQGSARFRLRLREADDDGALADRDEEAFCLGRLASTVTLREAMTRALLAGGPLPSSDDVRAAYEAIILREELAGRGPTGFFKDTAADGHLAALGAWLAGIREIAADRPAQRSVARFGRATQHEDVDDIRPAIAIETTAPGADGHVRRPVRVEIVGRTELLLAPEGAPTASVILALGGGKSKKDDTRLQRDLLRAFLDHVALAAGAHHEGAREAIVVRPDGDAAVLSRSRIAALPASRAQAYLKTLVDDLLAGVPDADGVPTGVHAYLFPCEAVLAARRKAPAAPVAESVEQLRDAWFERPMTPVSTQYGPVPDAIERHDPPPAAEAEAMAARRFDLFFELFTTRDEP